MSTVICSATSSICTEAAAVSAAPKRNDGSNVKPLECGRYICGIKITDCSSYNNGGAGGGSKQMFLYDKAAIYDGMIGSGLFTLN